MSTENELEARTSSPDTYTTLSGVSRQEGKFPSWFRKLDRASGGFASGIVNWKDVFLHGESGRERFSLPLAVKMGSAAGLAGTGYLIAPIVQERLFDRSSAIAHAQELGLDTPTEVVGADVSEDTPDPALLAQAVPETTDPLASFFNQINEIEQGTNINPNRLKVIQDLKIIIEAKGISMPNPLWIDTNEALEYAKSPDKTVFNTFRVWSTPDGQNSIIIVTGSRPAGTNQGFSSPWIIEGVEAALKRLDQMDPNIIGVLKNYDLKALSGNVPVFDIRPTMAAGFSKSIGTIHINEKGLDREIFILQFMHLILMESRHMYIIGKLNIPGRLDRNSGIDKTLFADQWARAFFAKDDKSGELRVWLDWDRLNRDVYIKDPFLSGDFFD